MHEALIFFFPLTYHLNSEQWRCLFPDRHSAHFIQGIHKIFHTLRVAVTTKSNSYITVEVMIALKFIYYFTFFLFLPGQKMQKEKKKKKKSNVKQEYKWLHTKYLRLHPVSYWQNITYLFFTSTISPHLPDLSNLVSWTTLTALPELF